MNFNYEKPGDILDIANASDTPVAANDAVQIAPDFYGIALRGIPAGKTGACNTRGLYHGKAAGAITKGAVVYLSSGKLSATPASGTKIGIALAAATAEGDDVPFVLNAGVSGYTAPSA